MHLLSCDACGKTQQTQSFVCPNCGSDKTMILHNLISMMPLESVSFSVLVQHRVWSFLPAGIQSSLDEMPAEIMNRKIKGKCLMAMISMAALVEGVLTDAIESELEAMQQGLEKRTYAEKQLKELKRATWRAKKEIAKACNTPAIARFFYQEAIAFLRSFLETVPLRNENNLRQEFEEAV